jgi:hypothetical protein
MPKTITRKQQGLMFSKNSPLTAAQRKKLAREIASGAVKIKDKKRKKR